VAPTLDALSTIDQTTGLKGRIRSFWEAGPCGAKHASAPEGSPEFFAEVERARYELEPFIGRFAGWSDRRDHDVLEVGVGLGTDFVRFARAGARATGIDLTERGVALVRRRLSLEGLQADVQVADAEVLPFADASFDFTYSWGVLHHTPDTVRAVREAIRVTRPGGEVCVMLYARRSWVALGLWLRYALLRGKPWRSLSDVVADNMESAGTKAYTGRELKGLFAGLEDLRIDRVGTPYDRRVAGPLAAASGRWLGWFAVVRGRRPF
jgi:SAM-dependent methyltransferase